jgi:hypothetical protein
MEKDSGKEKLKFSSAAKNVVSRRLFEQEIVEKLSRVSRPMGHRFIKGQAAERDGEEEYDQDNDKPLQEILFIHSNPLPSR